MPDLSIQLYVIDSSPELLKFELASKHSQLQLCRENYQHAQVVES
jgi:hypothetical protein